FDRDVNHLLRVHCVGEVGFHYRLVRELEGSQRGRAIDCDQPIARRDLLDDLDGAPLEWNGVRPYQDRLIGVEIRVVADIELIAVTITEERIGESILIY